jgi:hypothetical protein
MRSLGISVRSSAVALGLDEPNPAWNGIKEYAFLMMKRQSA